MGNRTNQQAAANQNNPARIVIQPFPNTISRSSVRVASGKAVMAIPTGSSATINAPSQNWPDCVQRDERTLLIWRWMSQLSNCPYHGQDGHSHQQRVDQKQINADVALARAEDAREHQIFVPACGGVQWPLVISGYSRIRPKAEIASSSKFQVVTYRLLQQCCVLHFWLCIKKLNISIIL